MLFDFNQPYIKKEVTKKINDSMNEEVLFVNGENLTKYLRDNNYFNGEISFSFGYDLVMLYDILCNIIEYVTKEDLVTAAKTILKYSICDKSIDDIVLELVQLANNTYNEIDNLCEVRDITPSVLTVLCAVEGWTDKLLIGDYLKVSNILESNIENPTQAIIDAANYILKYIIKGKVKISLADICEKLVKNSTSHFVEKEDL